jgi:NADH:ubiquinone oxidoreductase subunit 4 (subunit M)
MIPLVAVIVWLGVYPQPVLDTTAPLVNSILEGRTEQAVTPAPESDDTTISYKEVTHEQD